MKRLWLALGLAAFLPTGASAQIHFPEVITVPVNALSTGSFEVLEKPLVGPAQMWCAAGVFAEKQLGLRKGSLTILDAYGPAKTQQGGRGVVFTTQPVAGAFKDLSAGYRKAGKEMSIGLATALCQSDPDIRIRVRTDTGIYRP